MKPAVTRHTRPIAPRRQRGVVLFIALIVLVAMALAGIAMVRSVDTALGVAGNLAFKQASVQAAERGVATAFTFLSTATGTQLDSDDAANGYKAALAADTNWFLEANWGAAVDVFPNSTDAAGNRVRYQIHRMCSLTGPFGDTQCALYTPTGGATTGSTMQVGATQFTSSPSVYYRITTRVDGPRNTVSITQATVIITTAT